MRHLVVPHSEGWSVFEVWENYSFWVGDFSDPLSLILYLGGGGIA